MSSKKLTAKARELRKRQLERLGHDDDKIIDILEYEFDLGLGTAPGTPLRGKRFKYGGAVLSGRGGKFKGVM